MEAYVTEVCAINQSLLAIKAGLDDEFIAIIMLAGLTDEYNPLVMAIEYSSTKITTESVMSALLKDGQRDDKEAQAVTRDDAVLNIAKARKGKVISHFC